MANLIKVFGNATYLTHFTPQQIEKLCQLHPIWANQQPDGLWISLFNEYWKVDMPVFYRKNPRKSFLNNIPPLRNSSTIVAGDNHSLVILDDGTIKAWGDNNYGQPNVPPTDGRRFVAIATGGWHSLGLLEDGTAIGWGNNYHWQTDVPNTGDKKFVAIATGAWHSLGILDDGTIKAWGYNKYGQTDVPDTNGKKFVGIAAGDRHSLGLLEDGTVKAWGANDYGQTNIPDTNGKKFVAIATGGWHSLGILDDGTAIGWGDNNCGQTDVPDTNGRRFVGIAARVCHSLAILEDGTAIGWGYNQYGQTNIPDTNGRRFVAIATGKRHSLGLLEDGTVLAWGWNAYGQTNVPDTKGKKYLAHKYFLSYKFTGVPIEQLFQEITPIRTLVEKQEHAFFCNLYDDEMYQEKGFTPRQIMEHALGELESSTHCLVYVTEFFGGGSAMEVGYAIAKGLPIIALIHARLREEKMTSLKALASQVIYFENTDDLVKKLETRLVDRIEQTVGKG